MSKFKPLRENRIMLLPPAVEDFVPDGHFSRLVSRIVDELDSSSIEDKYSHLGQNTYHPKILLKILFYGYATGIRSGRKLAALCQTDTAFMYLAQMRQPDFRTINDFRKNNLNMIETYFIDIIGICQRLGMVKAGRIAIDGTKIKANAATRLSKDKQGFEKLLEKTREDIKKILDEAEATDAQEDELYGDTRGDELPEELRSKKALKDKIKEAIKNLGDDEKSKVNMTDSDAKLMKERHGVIKAAYNCQLSVTPDQIIVAADVSTEPNDRTQLVSMVEMAEANTGETSSEILADSGYASFENYEYLSNQGKCGYIPDQYLRKLRDGLYQEEQQRYHKENFTYDPDGDNYVCPEGKTLKLSKLRISDKGIVPRKQAIYRGAECPDCVAKSLCTAQKQRTVARDLREGLQTEMRERLQTAEGSAIYKTRMYAVEPPFGHLKHNLGYRSFLLRSVAKAKGEFKLMCIGYNLKKIWSRQFAAAI